MADRKNKGGGYCRPPKEHQFKPGQSGNLAGRPRKTKPNLHEAILRELESEKDFPTKNGTVVRMTKLEAFAKSYVDTALKQPLKAFDVIAKVTGYAANDNGATGLSEAQEEILKRALGPKPGEEGEPP